MSRLNRALTELYHAHKVQSIAVSNFGKQELACLPVGGVKPVANQLRVCVSCGAPAPIVAENEALDVVVQAYSPLGSGSVLSDPRVQNIAKTHGVSTAQVALRWVLQHNVTIATQSTNPDHLAEDVAIFQFALTDAEMKVLDGV